MEPALCYLFDGAKLAPALHVGPELLVSAKEAPPRHLASHAIQSERHRYRGQLFGRRLHGPARSDGREPRILVLVYVHAGGGFDGSRIAALIDAEIDQP